MLMSFRSVMFSPRCCCDCCGGDCAGDCAGGDCCGGDWPCGCAAFVCWSGAALSAGVGVSGAVGPFAVRAGAWRLWLLGMKALVKGWIFPRCDRCSEYRPSKSEVSSLKYEVRTKLPVSDVR